MVEWLRGAKAGLVAGGVWAVITAVQAALNSPSIGAAGSTALAFAAARLVYGLVWGLIFAAVADRFMVKRTYELKGVVFGLIFGAVEIALSFVSFANGGTDILVNLAVGILSSFIFGYVLGYSYGKLQPVPFSRQELVRSQSTAGCFAFLVPDY